MKPEVPTVGIFYSNGWYFGFYRKEQKYPPMLISESQLLQFLPVVIVHHQQMR